MYQTTTLRLKLNKTQQQHFIATLNHTLRLYNRMLQHRIKHYKRSKRSISFKYQSKLLSRLRQRYPEIGCFAQRAQIGILRKLEEAFKSFFRRIKQNQNPGFPRFKNYQRWNSFSYVNIHPKIKNGSIQIPNFGNIKHPRLQQIQGKICNLRILHKPRGWYLQVVSDTGMPPKSIEPQSWIGIDVGLSSFAVMSNGEEISNPRFAKKFSQKVKRTQRALSRKIKGSNRRRKQKASLTKIHDKIKGSRKNFIHQLSRQVINKYDFIAAEKLNIKGMVRSRFSKSILDAAWSFLFWCLSYKAEKAGKIFVQVDPKGTTQNCSQCGIVVPKTIRDRKHECPACGLQTTRDHNASLEILKRGLLQYGLVEPEFKRVESPVRGTMKCVGSK